MQQIDLGSKCTFRLPKSKWNNIEDLPDLPSTFKPRKVTIKVKIKNLDIPTNIVFLNCKKVDVQLEVLFQNKKERAYQCKQITNQILVFEALNVYEGFCFSKRKKEIHQNGYFSKIIYVMDVNMKFGQVQQKSKVEHNFKIIYFVLFRGHSNNTWHFRVEGAGGLAKMSHDHFWW